MKKQFIPSISKRIPGLDELRGMAALLVILVHANFLFPALVSSRAGVIAVDIFLIISGFLIGQILLKAKEDSNYFRRFYVRRLFRIAPLSWVAIGSGIGLSLLLNRSLRSVPYYLFFVQNFIPVDLVNPENSAAWIGPLPGCSPLWSLAVEEHFYLLLPLIIRFVPLKRLPVVLMGIAVSCLFLKVWGTHQEVTWYSNPHDTWMRVPYLLVGVVLNLECWKKCLVLFFSAWAIFLAWLELPLVWVELPVCLILSGLVYGAISGRWVLKNRFLAFSGKICFGLYVLHYFVRAGFDNAGVDYASLGTWARLAVLCAYVGGSYLLAVVSFYCFEMPVQRWRTRFEGA